jgi:hypothetical protein
MRKWIALAPVLIAIAGCGDRNGGYTAQPAPPAQPIEQAAAAPGDLMPLREGNRWVFAVESEQAVPGQMPRSERYELVYTVRSVQERDGGRVATIVVAGEGRPEHEQEWIANERGIYQISISQNGTRRAYDPPMPLVVQPVEAGRDWTWTGTGLNPAGTVGRMSVKARVLPSQEVDSDAGRFEAVPVESNTTFTVQTTEARAESTVWLRPGVGIVRYRQDIGVGEARAAMVLKLQSFEVKP